MIGHEMFGPVRVPKYLEYIADIRQSGVHLLDVINDILDISKVESGTVVLEQASVDLGEIIETCHRLVMPRAEAKSLDLTIEIADTIPAIRSDRRRIIQLLLNLLANAIKFTEDGGNIVSRVVHMPLGEVAMSVCDSGIGISAENIENAVEPFLRSIARWPDRMKEPALV